MMFAASCRPHCPQTRSPSRCREIVDDCRQVDEGALEAQGHHVAVVWWIFSRWFRVRYFLRLLVGVPKEEQTNSNLVVYLCLGHCTELRSSASRTNSPSALRSPWTARRASCECWRSAPQARSGCVAKLQRQGQNARNKRPWLYVQTWQVWSSGPVWEHSRPADLLKVGCPSSAARSRSC